MRTKRNGHRSKLGHPAFARPRRDVWGLFFLGLATTTLAVGAGLFLADASLEPKTSPQPVDQTQSAPQEPAPAEPEPEPAPTEEPETTTPSQPEPAPEETPPSGQPETPPPGNDTQQPQISEPDVPPEPVQPPVEIDNVDLEPIETIETEEILPGPEPDPNPNPEPEPKPGGSIADQIKLSAGAKTEYWDHVNPQIVSAEKVRENCKQVEHIVHGCYLRRGRLERIYIVDTSCPGLTESTAVHELLHAIYSHIDRNDRKKLDQLVLDFYAQNQAQFDNLLAPYDNLSDEGRINELHSFIGQSVKHPPAELRQHYNRYFADGRTAAIDYHNQYQSLLDSRRQEIQDLSRQIDELQDQIEQKRREIDAMRSQINDDLAWFEAQEKLLGELRADLTDPSVNARYNQLVDEYSQRVGEYRQRATQYNRVVNEHNQLASETRQKVDRHNQIVGEINRINRGNCQGIDS